MSHQLAEAFHDVFGEEHSVIFLVISCRVVVNCVDNVDIGWMHDCAV